MALVVRYVCHHCGAARQGATGAGWVRCQHCEALIAFDWQAWFGSPAYAAYLKAASKPEHLAGWQRYQALSEQAAAQARRGNSSSALATFRQAAELMHALNPSLHPEEASTKPAWREQWLTQVAWVLLQQKVDPVASALQAELLARLGKLDYRDPLPTLEAAIANLSAQYARFEVLGPPEDPDGMPLPQRLRAALSQFIGGYLQMVGPAQQRALLERIHGAGNVTESAQGGDSGVGLFREWRCPACGLHGLQGRMVHEYTCLGCLYRKPVTQADLGLTAVALKCGRCGAPLSLGEGELERTCDSCGTWNRRVARTGAVERDFARDVMAEHAASHGLTLATLPAEGQPGTPVTFENRRVLQATGLARTASAWAAFLGPEELLKLIRLTFGTRGEALNVAVRAVRAAAVHEGGSKEALALIDGALRRLEA